MRPLSQEFKSKKYWQDHKDGYPYRVKVPHRLPEDVDPRKFRELTRCHFLRVPFGGEAHWGFKDEATRDLFLKVGGCHAAARV